ncbi:MAG: hypothetical protein AB7S62_02930 [Azoarcus sp.]
MVIKKADEGDQGSGPSERKRITAGQAELGVQNWNCPEKTQHNRHSAAPGCGG